MNEIEKIFIQDIKTKKRIGNNIFNRVATRKGGRTQALKTPYTFMTAKERKQLNGEVITYNMNDIISYHDFMKKSFDERVELMNRWRKMHKINDILEQMGISRNKYYRLLNILGIEKKSFSTTKQKLSDEELKKYKNELIPFDRFKGLIREQKIILLQSYLDKYGSPSQLTSNWEGADLRYIYNVNRYLNKLKKENNEISTNPSGNTTKTEDKLDNNIQNKDVKMNQNQENNQTINENTSRNTANKNSSNITINTDAFDFKLKGNYDAKTIIKRLQVVIDLIDDDNHTFDIEINIKQKQ